MLLQYFLLFSDALIPEWLCSSLLLFHLALRSLMISLKWISSSVSGLCRYQDRKSICTIYFPPHSICTIYSLTAKTEMILFAFSVDFHGGLAHYAWWTSKITRWVPWNYLCLFLGNVKAYLPKWCDPFLLFSSQHIRQLVFATVILFLIFYLLLNSQERSLGRIEK